MLLGAPESDEQMSAGLVVGFEVLRRAGAAARLSRRASAMHPAQSAWLCVGNVWVGLVFPAAARQQDSQVHQYIDPTPLQGIHSGLKEQEHSLRGARKVGTPAEGCSGALAGAVEPCCAGTFLLPPADASPAAAAAVAVAPLPAFFPLLAAAVTQAVSALAPSPGQCAFFAGCSRSLCVAADVLFAAGGGVAAAALVKPGTSASGAAAAEEAAAWP